MKKQRKRIVHLDGSCLQYRESKPYQEDLVLRFSKDTGTEVQTAVIELDLFDLEQLAGCIHRHVAFQQAKLDRLRKALKGEQ